MKVLRKIKNGGWEEHSEMKRVGEVVMFTERASVKLRQKKIAPGTGHAYRFAVKNDTPYQVSAGMVTRSA